ncbi:hypothetical protein [Ureibacillus acetophenoni]
MKESIYQVLGAYDCISAKIIEQLGFRAAYMTGFGENIRYSATRIMDI